MAKTETGLSTTDVIDGSAREYVVQKPSRKPGQLLGMSIDRTGWTEKGASLTLTMHVSLDNGKTWQEWCSLTDTGGEELGPDGTPMLTASWACTPPPESALVKVSASSTGKSVQQAFSMLEVT